MYTGCNLSLIWSLEDFYCENIHVCSIVMVTSLITYVHVHCSNCIMLAHVRFIMKNVYGICILDFFQGAGEHLPPLALACPAPS